jgi:malonyl-CoA O-methyltransferase
MSIQQPDGSFSGPEKKISYPFDTGQVIRGFLASLHDMPSCAINIHKACDWIITQIGSDGRLAIPSTGSWIHWADERIHLYILPPLIEAGKKLNEPKYIKAAYQIFDSYKKEDLAKFNILSHFYAYIIEALCEIGEIELAERAIAEILGLQSRTGSIPAYPNVGWVCSTGVAQFAVVLFRLGHREQAESALSYLENLQSQGGGFCGSYGYGANYLSEQEISWTVKFFLDAYLWRVKSAFNEKVDSFPDSINKRDGRVQEILSFLGDLNGKKVMDIGCGKGRFLRILKEEFPGAELYGIDISETMLRYCPESVRSSVGTLLDIGFPDNYFDCVYSVEALEHALRAKVAVKEMCRILRPGGKVVIIDKNRSKLGALEIEPWEQWFGRREILRSLRAYGVKPKAKIISYEDHQPDGLFIAWEGTKRI